MSDTLFELLYSFNRLNRCVTDEELKILTNMIHNSMYKMININKLDVSGRTLLTASSRKEVINMLLDLNVIDIYKEDKYRYNGLLKAANDIDMVKRLVYRNVDIHYKNSMGYNIITFTQSIQVYDYLTSLHRTVEESYFNGFILRLLAITPKIYKRYISENGVDFIDKNGNNITFYLCNVSWESEKSFYNELMKYSSKFSNVNYIGENFMFELYRKNISFFKYVIYHLPNEHIYIMKNKALVDSINEKTIYNKVVKLIL